MKVNEHMKKQKQKKEVVVAVKVMGFALVMLALITLVQHVLTWAMLLCLLGGSFIAFGPDIAFGLRALADLSGGDYKERVDKLAAALGLKWQVVPERRKWVTDDTPDPEEEDEQPQVLSLDRR